MARGRPPKPLERVKVNARDATHKANGSELVKTEYTLERKLSMPVSPDNLGERGQEEWEKIWSAGYWLSDEQDYHWVAMVATAYDEIEAYRREIAAEGLTVMGIKGTMVAHPLIAEIRKAQATIMRCLSQLGFSPTDRARLGLAEVKRKTALVDLAERMKSK